MSDKFNDLFDVFIKKGQLRNPAALLPYKGFLKLFKIYVGELLAGATVIQTFCLDILDHFLKTFCKLFKVFLVEENLVLVVCEVAVIVYLALAFCDRQVVIVALCGLDVKEVCTLSSSYRLLINVLA